MSGLIEIGPTDHGDAMAIISRHTNFRSTETYQNTISYYQWARTKATEGKFRSERDQLIWEHHAEGVSQRQIAPKLGLSPNAQGYLSRKIKTIKSYLSCSVSMELAYY